jgi:hypothetical protein
LSFFLFRTIIALNEIFEAGENVGRGRGGEGAISSNHHLDHHLSLRFSN